MNSRVKKEQLANLTIRELELDDLSKVFALGERLFTAEEWPTLYRTWDEYELVTMFASDGETCLVAEYEENIVGFVLGTLIEKRRGAWRYGYLVWLGVEPDLAQRGIGTTLVDELTAIFINLGARMMIVDTEAGNQSAIGLFKKMGFGNQNAHVYLSKNLTRHPQYIRRKKKKAKNANNGS